MKGVDPNLATLGLVVLVNFWKSFTRDSWRVISTETSSGQEHIIIPIGLPRWNSPGIPTPPPESFFEFASNLFKKSSILHPELHISVVKGMIWWLKVITPPKKGKQLGLFAWNCFFPGNPNWFNCWGHQPIRVELYLLLEEPASSNLAASGDQLLEWKLFMLVAVGGEDWKIWKIEVHHKNRKLHGKNPAERLTGSESLGDVGFLLFFRVVSGDYGKPC